MTQLGDGWRKCNTLGSKAKVFCWKLDNEKLIVRRQFKSKIHPSGEVTDERLITTDQLDKIHQYVYGRLETGLHNNVEKLTARTEEEGLGKFMFEMFGGKDTNYGQLASHIAALFVESGSWTKNNVQRGMQFKANAIDWKPCLKAYYNGSPDCTMTN